MIGIIRADGSTLRLRFAHAQQKGERGKPQEPVMYLHPGRTKHPGPIRALTSCFLETGDKMRPITLALAHARCAMADNFVKETGRELALHTVLIHALDAGQITLAERGMLLEAYFNRPRGPRAPTTTTTTPHSQEPS